MIIKGHEVCDFCFKEKNSGDVCEYCGLTHENYVPAEGALLPGTVLHDNKYVIGRLLCYDYINKYYLAYDVMAERVVMIKEFYPKDMFFRLKTTNTVLYTDVYRRGEGEKLLARFKKIAETRIAFNENRNMQSVYELFSENATEYCAMEYLTGGFSHRVIINKEEKLKESEAIKVFRGIGNALKTLHEARCIHGAVTPQSIYITDEDEIKLLEFECFRPDSIGNGWRISDMAFSSVFSPLEMLTNKREKGAGTDIYMLGASVYLLLTGVAPPDAIDRIENPELKFDESLNISRKFINIIKKCMELNLKDRYSNISELMNDLSALQLEEDEDGNI